MTDLGPRLMATSRRNRARNNTVAVPIKRKLVARDNVWHVLMSPKIYPSTFIFAPYRCVVCTGNEGEEERKSERESLDKCGLA